MNLWLKRYFRNKVKKYFYILYYKHLLNLVKTDNTDIGAIESIVEMYN
jgi:hypothetical protein